LQCSGGPKAAVSGRPTPLFYRHVTSCQTKPYTTETQSESLNRSLCLCVSVVKRFLPHTHTYPSFAVIEIFAFNTFDTGQPFSAASAYF